MKHKLFQSQRLRTTRELVQRSEELFADRVAFRELDRERQVQEYTYRQLARDVDSFGAALLHHGLMGKHIALLGENCYRWVVSYLAIAGGLGVVVPLDKELPAGDIAKLLRKSNSDAVICTALFAPLIRSVLPECPVVTCCVDMGNSNHEEPGFLAFDRLLEEGSAILAGPGSPYPTLPIDPDSLCEIIFTSGTTGANKGVMLCQRNVMAVLHGIMQLIQAEPVSISVLPISHSYECTCHVLGGIYSGITVCFNDSLKHLMDNLRLFRPGMSLMVPLFLETMHRQIWKEAEKANLAGHLRYGIAFSNLLRKLGIDMRRLYFKPILEKFGGNLRQIVCGGAPLREELIKGFGDIGIDVVNGYGITECAPVISTNSTAWQRAGSVGLVLPVCDVRIDMPDEKGNGEVLVRGDTVMLGYYNDEEATKAAFAPDGYFKTGDLGRLDRRGVLHLTGRKKNLIVLSNGKNVCPEEVEEAILGQIGYVREVVVYSHSAAGRQETIVADVYLDPEHTGSASQAELRERLEQDIRRLNNRLPAYKRVQEVRISQTEFEKTTTRKIKRQVVLEGRASIA